MSSVQVTAKSAVPEIMGPVVSTTVKVVINGALVLPHSSSASQVMVLTKSFAQTPAVVTSLTWVTVTVPLQLSVAVGGLGRSKVVAQINVESKLPAVVDQVGTTLSLTESTAVKVVLVFPHSSVASQVMVRVKSLAQFPVVVMSLVCVTVTVPTQLSVAIGGLGTTTSAAQIKEASRLPAVVV